MFRFVSWTQWFKIARISIQMHSRPQSHDPSDLRQGSRALAGPDFLSMCRVFVSYSQPIRFARFDGKSVNRGLPVLDKVRALDPCRRSEWSWALGTKMDPDDDMGEFAHEPYTRSIGTKLITWFGVAPSLFSNWKANIKSKEILMKIRL